MNKQLTEQTSMEERRRGREGEVECLHAKFHLNMFTVGFRWPRTTVFGQILAIVADYSVSPAPCIFTLLRIRVDMI